MPRIMKICAALLALIGTAHAANTSPYGPGYMPGPLTSPQAQAVARYGEAVNRQLYDRFGLGAKDRNVYCEGPAVIRFEIMPDGSVRGLRLVRRSLPKLNAGLITRLGTMRFRRFDPGMPNRPYVKLYHYGVTPLAEFHFNAEKLACR